MGTAGHRQVISTKQTSLCHCRVVTHCHVVGMFLFTKFVIVFAMYVCGRLKYEKDLVVNLEYEQGKMTALCDQEAKQISRLKEVLEIVKQYVFRGFVVL